MGKLLANIVLRYIERHPDQAVDLLSALVERAIEELRHYAAVKAIAEAKAAQK
jgi:hypothetical protein